MAARTEGQRLLRARVKAGEMQSEIAKAIDRSAPTVWAWVTGKYVPDVAGAVALEREFGIPVEAWTEKPQRRPRGNGKKAA